MLVNSILMIEINIIIPFPKLLFRRLQKDRKVRYFSKERYVCNRVRDPLNYGSSPIRILPGPFVGQNIYILGNNCNI
jgi:hypothetical protein